MENDTWIHWPHPSRLKWKAPEFEGKMGVIMFTTATKRQGQAVSTGYTGLRRRGQSCMKSSHFKNARKHNPNHLLVSQKQRFQKHTNIFQCSPSCFQLTPSDEYVYSKKSWSLVFKPKACIDSKLSHPLQDVVSDRPVHTSWALFVPGMWSPSNRSQQLSQWNGKRRIGAESGRGGHCINIASTISPPPQSSCSVPLHTKTLQ